MIRSSIYNWRYYVLTIVCALSLIGIFSLPTCSGLQWLITLIMTKVLGFYFGSVFARLIAYWNKRNEIPELSKIMNDIKC